MSTRSKRRLVFGIVFVVLILSLTLSIDFVSGEPQEQGDSVVKTTTSSSWLIPSTTVETATTTTTAPPTTTTLPPTTLPPTTLPPVTTVPPPPPVEEVEVSTVDQSGPTPVEYWDRMAQCETGGNWQHFPYGTWTGGLGIYNQTWLGWGGGEFAPTAGQATREQQIIVADRIAVLGYGNLGPVGYSAWGCVHTVGYP